MSARTPRERFNDPAFRSTDRFIDLQRDAPVVRGPDGRQRCRWCGGPVPRGRISWCSHECVADATIRTGRDVESLVRARDHGICHECGLDTMALADVLHRVALRGSRGLVFDHLGIPRGRQRLWEADHIVGVLEGGGCCGLANYRTLCHWCHLDRTGAQQGERVEARRQRARPVGLFDQCSGNPGAGRRSGGGTNGTRCSKP